MIDFLPPPPSWSVQLEWPQEVGSILKVRSNVQDLMDQILDTNDSKLPELILNDVIGSYRLLNLCLVSIYSSKLRVFVESANFLLLFRPWEDPATTIV